MFGYGPVVVLADGTRRYDLMEPPEGARLVVETPMPEEAYIYVLRPLLTPTRKKEEVRTEERTGDGFDLVLGGTALQQALRLDLRASSCAASSTAHLCHPRSVPGVRTPRLSVAVPRPRHTPVGTIDDGWSAVFISDSPG